MGIFLAFAHQVAGGTHFVDSPVARGLWILLYAGTAAALLTWRVVLPLLAHRRYGMRVSAVVPEANGLASVWVHGHGLSRLGAPAAASSSWSASSPAATARRPTPTRCPWHRPTTTCGSPSARSATTRPPSRTSGPGTRVQVEGPFGTFTADRATSDRVLLVAGGAGIGPVRALAEELLAQGRQLVVLHRAHDADELALAAEFTPSPRPAYVPVPGRRAQLGYDPLDPQHLRAARPGHRVARRVRLRPARDGDAVARSARALGVPRSAIHREELDS